MIHSHSLPESQCYPWYALHVRSNHERVAAAHLDHRGLEGFAPTFLTERHWSDRKKQVDQFLFPGYVFCRLNLEDRLPVLTVPGAIRLVGFGNGPAPIPADEIDSVRKMAGSGLWVAPWPFLQKGQRVTVEQGPLAGVEGILQESKKSFRLVVSIQILQRSISVELQRDWVRPLAQSTPIQSGILNPFPERSMLA